MSMIKNPLCVCLITFTHHFTVFDYNQLQQIQEEGEGEGGIYLPPGEQTRKIYEKKEFFFPGVYFRVYVWEGGAMGTGEASKKFKA